jgi:hypothetical protein
MVGDTARAFILATALVGSAVAAAPSANTGTRFDGYWKAVGFERTRVCITEPAHFEGYIINGIIQYGAKGIITVSGHVAPKGAVTLTISAGPYHAWVYGRLSNNSGSGTWRVQGAEKTCSGTWSARRTGTMRR